MQRESKHRSGQVPDETLGTPKKKFKTRQGKVLRKSTQALALRHDNVHSGPSTATAGTPLPIDRNSRKHEKSTGSTVVLPSSSTPTPPSFSLLAILAAIGGLGAALFHDSGYTGSHREWLLFAL